GIRDRTVTGVQTCALPICLAERLVTIAREGNNFNARRRALSLLPYKEEALIKLFKEIAPRYVQRNGGYTRVIPLGKRISDTATEIGRASCREREDDSGRRR